MKDKHKNFIKFLFSIWIVVCLVAVLTSPMTRPVNTVYDKEVEVMQYKVQQGGVIIPKLEDNTRKSEGVETTTEIIDEVKSSLSK